MSVKIHGETQGLKNITLEALSSLYEIQIPQDQLWTEELIKKISYISLEINREIALYLDRKGHITDVSIGSNQTVTLAAVEGKRNTHRLSGTRCIHTHPKGSGMLSSVDISSLKLLSLDAMIAVGILNDMTQELYVGIPSPDSPEDVAIYGPYAPAKKDFNILLENIIDADQILRKMPSENPNASERTILVGLHTPHSRDLYGESEDDVSFRELEDLAKTAGATVVGRLMQKRDTRKSITIIGQGKLEELRLMAQSLAADLVIFDEELSGTQQHNIEEAIGVKVLCRTGLILDIFAQRARSREGILQVELAQLEYRLPRLMGMGVSLSRLGGGIGTRGPGESKLETDRRHIRTRIVHLKEQLKAIRRQREVLRGNRQKNGISVVSIVGYTNAGKSTLLNTLCDADVWAEDILFATLDTTTRKLILNNGRTILLSDTVGFIRNLPHKLLNAFKSTLEEVVLSDLILIVADASDPQVEDHIRIVDEILSELGANTKPALIILNKIDRLPSDNPIGLGHEMRPVFEISAKRGDGLNELKQCIESTLFSNRILITLAIPITEGAILSWIHTNCRILNVSYNENFALVDAELDQSLLPKVKSFIKA